MTLRFAYLTVPRSQPIVPLRGRQSRPRPIIAVRVNGPSGSVPQDALLDTGADDTVFPESVARRIGLVPTTRTGAAGSALQTTAQLWYAQVQLAIADNQEQREWTAWVGFTDGPLHMPLLGF